MSPPYPTIVTTTCGHPTHAVVAFANDDLHRLFSTCRGCLPQRVRLATKCADRGVFLVEPVETAVAA